MKIYTVYLKHNSDPLQDAEYVAEGFSWKAFFFSFFWLVYNKLWVQAAATFIAFLIIGELSHAEFLGSTSYAIMSLGICLYIGLSGRDFLRSRYESEGFHLTDVVIANSVDEAEFRFINELMKKTKEVHHATHS